MEVRLGQSHNMDGKHPNDEERENRSTSHDGGGGVDLGGGVGRFYGWPSSRIVRVSRASGGKDRHSKVLTSKGLRDRRVRLSVNTAIQFYDLQDRLGYDQPSKAVEWLLAAAASSIAELPPMNTHFWDTSKGLSGVRLCNIAAAEVDIGSGNSGQFQQEAVTKSPAGSSNSETSKGSGISIVRSEGRFEAREGANDGVAEKEKEIDNESSYLSSFSELLSGKINFINESVNQDYFTSGLSGPPAARQEQIVPLPLLSAAAAAAATATDYHHTERQHLSFASDNLVSVNSPGFAAIDRGTLQSNSPLPLSNFPPLPNFFTGAAVPTGNHHHFLPGFDARLQLYYGDAHSNDGRHSGQKEEDKN